MKVRVRALDQFGKPVSGAKVSVDNERIHLWCVGPFCPDRETDGEGVAEFMFSPTAHDRNPDNHCLYVEKPLYKTKYDPICDGKPGIPLSADQDRDLPYDLVSIKQVTVNAKAWNMYYGIKWDVLFSAENTYGPFPEYKEHEEDNGFQLPYFKEIIPQSKTYFISAEVGTQLRMDVSVFITDYVTGKCTPVFITLGSDISDVELKIVLNGSQDQFTVECIKPKCHCP